MNNVLVWFFTVTLTLSSVARAVDLTLLPDLKLNLRQEQGKTVIVSFASSVGKSYQVSASRDLKLWEIFGEPLIGTGGTISFDFSNTNEPTVFFRFEAVATAALRIEQAQNNAVKVTFSTTKGRKYLVFTSTNLRQWEATGDLMEGSGAPITIEGKQESNRYYKLEEIQATPVAGMVWIKAGKFVMGSPLEEKNRDLDEDPLTQVTLPHGFWMGKFELTQKEYEAVVGSNPSGFTGNPNRPVEQVSWVEAVAYCSKLTEQEQEVGRLPPGYAYRLPTEAEFEYASRAGASTRFSFGEDPDFTDLGKYAWYNSNSGDKSHPVGEKLPNAFGLYDMHGNVWEWCLDWYQSLYPGGDVIDPSGPASGGGRVFRGGGWDYTDASCRAAFRNSAGPGRQFKYVGFRLVLAPVRVE
ncbi:MAG: formylglycine-generating enzyme family protein [Pedosphaera sp.]|nr:formylglycine-generating enzyme family protein [Pedosphaera sp.]